jgi:hypothetical protein
MLGSACLAAEQQKVIPGDRVYKKRELLGRPQTEWLCVKMNKGNVETCSERVKYTVFIRTS